MAWAECSLLVKRELKVPHKSQLLSTGFFIGNGKSKDYMLFSPTLMVQGTTSDAGKSVLVVGLCRVLKRKGWHIAPFKPQNMALNSAVTEDGGEIGRAQAVQAMAAGVSPHTDMNPVLLKPHSDTGAQVIIQGRVVTDMEAVNYHHYKSTAMAAVMDSYNRLSKQYEAIIVEGAGSPAEINLRDRDIANMGFAEAADCPVIIVADIDRGGVFAHLVGTLELLSESEQNRVVGFVINRFRGDISLLQSGLDWLENKTGKPVLGVLPYLMGFELAAEDAINSQQTLDKQRCVFNVAVPVLSRISNHTDFDPLRLNPAINLVFVGPGERIPACDLIIIPGSKSVVSDLAFLREQGWDTDIYQHVRYGGKVFGICGGYQMLGESIDDPLGVESHHAHSQGLHLLPVSTELATDKQLMERTGRLRLFTDSGESLMAENIQGYEIHMGQTRVKQDANSIVTLDSGEVDGCVSNDNRVAGTYLHGIFDAPHTLRTILTWAGMVQPQVIDYRQQQNAEIDRFADACEQYLDWQKLELALSNNWRTLSGK